MQVREHGDQEVTLSECREVAHIIVSRRYFFDMPQWLWDVQPDENLEWALTHYLLSSTVALEEAYETIESYKGARRYKLDGKVTYQHVPCDW